MSVIIARGGSHGRGQMLSEHESETVRGLPGDLPAGETLLWQGAPAWWPLARRALHVRGLAVYFGAMLVWVAATSWAGDLLPFVRALAPLVAVTAAALGLICLYAWLTARGTVYSITDRRVVVRCGVALPKAINIPFAVITGASLRVLPDGTGDIVLRLERGHRIPYFMLWPHARPWKLSPAEPALRAVPQAAAVAQRLADALAITGGQAETVTLGIPRGRQIRPSAAGAVPA